MYWEVWKQASLLTCSLQNGSKRALKARNTTRSNCVSVRDGYVIPVRGFFLCNRKLDAVYLEAGTMGWSLRCLWHCPIFKQTTIVLLRYSFVIEMRQVSVRSKNSMCRMCDECWSSLQVRLAGDQWVSLHNVVAFLIPDETAFWWLRWGGTL